MKGNSVAVFRGHRREHRRKHHSLTQVQQTWWLRLGDREFVCTYFPTSVNIHMYVGYTHLKLAVAPSHLSKLIRVKVSYFVLSSNRNCLQLFWEPGHSGTPSSQNVFFLEIKYSSLSARDLDPVEHFMYSTSSPSSTDKTRRCLLGYLMCQTPELGTVMPQTP